MESPAEFWIIDTDELLSETLVSMLFVNELTSNCKVFTDLDIACKERHESTYKPQIILSEHSSKLDSWKLTEVTKVNTIKRETHIYFMGENYEIQDYDQFEDHKNVKRLFRKPLRLDELKWMMEGLSK